MTNDDYDRLFMRVLKKDGHAAAIRAVVEAAQTEAQKRITELEAEVQRMAEDAAGEDL